MDKQVLEAEKRKVFGRKVNALRKEGLLPGNIYGKKVKSEGVAVKLADFLNVYKEAGETSLISLVIKNGKQDTRAVLISNVQKNPVSDTPIHVDFRQVDLKEKVSASIPVELSGEAPAEKQAIGTVVQYLNEIEVEALPTDLPEKFVVDISALEQVDQAIFVKDLPVRKDKVEVKTEAESIVVKVEPPQKEEVVAPPPAEEVPVEGGTPPGGAAEGEVAVAEGEAVKTEESKAGGKSPKEQV